MGEREEKEGEGKRRLGKGRRGNRRKKGGGPGRWSGREGDEG